MDRELNESFVKPSGVNNPNYQRLSAMIENYTLHDDLDEEVYMPSRKNSPSDTTSEVSFEPSNPAITISQSYESSNSPQSNTNTYSPGNRESMASVYSGTVHEGVPISYIVKNKSATTVRKETVNEPVLPPLPSAREWYPASTDTLNNEHSSKKLGISASNVGTQPDETIIEDTTTSLNFVDKNNSLKLLSMEHSHQKVPSSVGSGNLGSESGHSYNYSTNSNSGSSVNNADSNQYEANLPKLSQLESSIKEESYEAGQVTSMSDQTPADRVTLISDNEQVLTTTPLNISQAPSKYDISQVSDGKSIVSSIIPTLETNLQNQGSGEDPEVEIISEIHPTVPPRSAKRPKSHIFIKESLDDIQNQLAKEMGSGSVSRNSSYSLKSESFFSATEQDHLGKSQTNNNDDNESEERYIRRPLPSIPNPKLEPPENDDDYEDIVEEVVEKGTNNNLGNAFLKSPHSKLPKTPSKSKSKSKTKNIGPKYRKELGSFDIDTISQLLSVTKGTLIGSEFANLGMKIEEKRALERLVDSLSRLTADMVLDPEKFQQGLKRLERATKALDGF